jgi:hypothetical protein
VAVGTGADAIEVVAEAGMVQDGSSTERTAGAAGLGDEVLGRRRLDPRLRFLDGCL